MRVLLSTKRRLGVSDAFSSVGLLDEVDWWLKNGRDVKRRRGAAQASVAMPYIAWVLLLQLYGRELYGPTGGYRKNAPAFKRGTQAAVAAAVGARHRHPAIRRLAIPARSHPSDIYMAPMPAWETAQGELVPRPYDGAAMVALVPVEDEMEIGKVIRWVPMDPAVGAAMSGDRVDARLFEEAAHHPFTTVHLEA